MPSDYVQASKESSSSKSLGKSSLLEDLLANEVTLRANFQNLFQDAEVEAQYKRLEDIQLNAPHSGSGPEVGVQDDLDGLGPVNETNLHQEAKAEEEQEGKKSKRFSIIDPKDAAERKKSQVPPKINKKSHFMFHKSIKTSFRTSRAITPAKWKRLVGVPAELRELPVKDLENETIWLAVLYPCKGAKVRRKLGVALRRDWTDLRLIFMGELIKDEDDIPDACYVAKSFNFLRWVDESSIEAYLRRAAEEEEQEKADNTAKLEALRRRQAETAGRRGTGAPPVEETLIGLDDAEDVQDTQQAEEEDEGGGLTHRSSDAEDEVTSTSQAQKGEGGGRGEGSSIDQSTAAPRKAEQGPPASNVFSPGSIRRRRLAQQDFDLEYELEQINCQQFASLLQLKGLGDKGAFAYVQEAELTGPGLWIPKKAAIRILGISDIYRRQFEIEDKVGLSKELSQITQSIGQQQKYTVDGINFFATQLELNNWLEAERKANALAANRGKQRVMSIKREHNSEVLDLIASIERRLKVAEEKEEGILSYAQLYEGGNFCCPKHHEAFDDQIDDIVEREAIDYDNDFLLILSHANPAKSAYLPRETLLAVVIDLFNRHKFCFRPKLIDDLMKQAALDGKDTYFDADILRHAAVELLKRWKRHLLLDLRGAV